MKFEENSENYDAFPESDINSQFQELSIRAFERVLPVSDWVVRDERVQDAGVDASIEVLINGRYTNQRAQIQLKSTSSTQINQDGSVSLSVEVHNLVYLLNGYSPLYVLYIVPRNELRFAWARDEQIRIDARKANWRQQGEVTLRFSRVINDEALSEIRERILREARLHKGMDEILGRASSNENVRVCIDPTTLRHTDPDKLLELILEQGISLANSGHPHEVVEAAQALNLKALSQPRVQLVLGYAYYLQGHFAYALAAITQATLGNSQLSADDQQFLSYLRDACNYHAGYLTFEQFSARQSHWADNASHSFAIGLRLSELRQALNSQTELSMRREQVIIIQSETQKIYEDTSISATLRHQALLFWLYAEGSQMAMEEMDDLSRVKIRQRVSQPSNATVIVAAHFERWRHLYAVSEQLRVEVVNLNHPLLLADFYFNRVTLGMMRLNTSHFISAIFSEDEETEPPEIVQILIDEAEKAFALFKATGQFHGQLHTRVLIAQLRLLLDDFEGACEIANSVLPIAQAMNYKAIENIARQTLEGTTPLDNARIRSFEQSKVDQDFDIAEGSDEFIKSMAADLLKTFNLPPERMPNLEASILSIRAIARERINWCQHLELIEDLNHASSPQTFYANPLKYAGGCYKVELQGSLEHLDFNVAIEQFKLFVCEGCPHRAPKQN